MVQESGRWGKEGGVVTFSQSCCFPACNEQLQLKFFFNYNVFPRKVNYYKVFLKLIMDVAFISIIYTVFKVLRVLRVTTTRSKI